MSVFRQLLSKDSQQSQVTKTFRKVSEILNTGTNTLPAGLAKRAIASESMDYGDQTMLHDKMDGLGNLLQGAQTAFGLKDLTRSQKDAAAIASILGVDPMAYVGKTTSMESMSGSDGAFVNAQMPTDAVGKRPAMEAFDETQNRNLIQRSVTYNLFAARQDDFGETLFPTIVIPPDVSGISVSTDIMYVYDGVTRDISGDPNIYNKQMLLRAFQNPDIMKMDTTRIVPVYRDESAKYFVADSLVAPIYVDHEGESIRTSALATGKRFSLLGISQPRSMLANGVNNYTDSIDPAITLKRLYVKVGQDVFTINTEALPYNTFNPPVQNNYKQMVLTMDTTGFQLNQHDTLPDGSDFVSLAAIKTNNFLVKFRLEVNGSVNIETAETVVHGTKVSVHEVRDANNTKLSFDDARVAPIVAAVEAGSIVGYELNAFRTNLNRRILGQLIDTTTVTNNYMVYMRSPVTTARPITTNGEEDTRALNTLITITHARTSADAVKTLIDTAATLKMYEDTRGDDTIPPDILGIGRYLVVPTYFKDEINLPDLVQSVSSVDRENAIQSALLGLLRNYVYRMYVQSQYQSATKARNGGVEKTPTVVIATDPKIARYLMQPGDLRTVGNEFDLRIVHTINKNMKGKMFVTFSNTGDDRNTDIDPLSFGFCAWAPELTIVTPMQREGGVNMELAVSPRYKHIVNLPILVEIDVTGVDELGDMLPFNVNNTPVTP